jgi:cytochrome c
MPLRIATTLLFALAAVSCDARAREIRSQLSDADLQRFNRGQQISSPCWSCHDFYGTQNKIGPYLSGIYGRRAAAAEFGGYSDALRSSMIMWDDRSLAAFLQSPQKNVPGSTMVSPGVTSAADLDALLFYMKLATAP